MIDQLCIGLGTEIRIFKINNIQNIKKFDKENTKLTYKKIESQLDFMLKGQQVNQHEL